jgi:hypothetical protein
MVRRQSNEEPLTSTFVSILEPYGTSSHIAQVYRLKLENSEGQAYPKANVAIELQMFDGSRDLIIAADVENPLGRAPAYTPDSMLVLERSNIRTDAQICLVRQAVSGSVSRNALCCGSFLQLNDLSVSLKSDAGFVEIAVADGRATVVAGDEADVLEIKTGRK